MWDERWEGYIFKCSDEIIASKVLKMINKSSFGKKVTNKDLLERFNVDSENVTIKTGIYSKGENKIIDKLVWKENLDDINANTILIKGRIVKPQVKNLDEAKGAVISDYQDYLDKKWIENLRLQYNIKVNDSVLSSIK
jgi:peptidyl-prolyl cis-trans isomerase SurA